MIVVSKIPTTTLIHHHRRRRRRRRRRRHFIVFTYDHFYQMRKLVWHVD